MVVTKEYDRSKRVRSTRVFKLGTEVHYDLNTRGSEHRFLFSPRDHEVNFNEVLYDD